MSITVESLPFKRTWLDDIIDELLHAPGGTDHVDAIVNRLMRTGRDLGKAPKETATRSINNYCRDAQDTDRVVTFPLFARVGPGTYKLLTYPNRPDLIEIRDIAFSDPAFQYVWGRFVDVMKHKHRAKWAGASQTSKLTVFVNGVVSESGALHYLFEEYAEIQKIAASVQLGTVSSAEDLAYSGVGRSKEEGALLSG